MLQRISLSQTQSDHCCPGIMRAHKGFRHVSHFTVIQIACIFAVAYTESSACLAQGLNTAYSMQHSCQLPMCLKLCASDIRHIEHLIPSNKAWYEELHSKKQRSMHCTSRAHHASIACLSGLKPAAKIEHLTPQVHKSISHQHSSQSKHACKAKICSGLQMLPIPSEV